MQDTTQGTSRHEEVDLLFVIRSIKKGIRNFTDFIGWMFSFTLKHFVVFILCVGFGLAIGYFLFTLKKPYYRSEFTTSHIRFENGYCSEMIDNLNSYVNDGGNNEGLAQVLNIDVNVANQVRCFHYKPFNERISKLYADSVSVLLPFKVEVEVYNNEILSKLQNSILNYLESNTYAQQLKEIEKKSLDLVEKRFIDEITEIDSLKQQVNKSIIPRASGSGVILGEAIEPVLIYKRAMDSYDRLMDVKKRKELNESFQLVIGFTKNNVVAGLGKKSYLAVGAIIGYFAGMLFLVVMTRRIRAKGTVLNHD